MTSKESLDRVIAELRAMNKEELIAEMDKHRNSDIACAIRELNDFGKCLESENNEVGRNQSSIY